MILLKKPSNIVVLAMFICMVMVLMIYVFKDRMLGLNFDRGDYKAQETRRASIPVKHDLQRPELSKVSESTSDDERVARMYRVRSNPVAMKEVKEWFAARGNYNLDDPTVQDDYKNYSLEILKKLSQAGDIRAMHQLIETSDDLNEKVNLAYRAALYGSTAAIERLGLIIEAKSELKQKTVEERKPHVIEILSYFEAAKLRGDESINIFSGEDLLRHYPTEITQDDRVYIKKRARDIYNNLQKNKADAGLGEFDNSVPNSVKEYFKELIGSDCDKALSAQSSKIYCE